MIDNHVVYETVVCTGEESFLVISKPKFQFLVTENEIVLNKLKGKREKVSEIPLHRIYDCYTKVLPQTRYSSYGIPYEFKNNFLLIDYLDEHDKRSILSLILCKYRQMPSNVVEAIRFSETIEKHQLRNKFISEGQTASSPQTDSSADIIEQIEKLAELHKSGILTDVEFEAKKAELLERI